ncbi:MAG TPA: metallophosphoesterase family protein [Ramlibacter sp.]|nr:metallophosphoesterase family protein [Ramlibacter sp.]
MASMKPQRTWPDARRIGLISDTHGLMRPEALAALQGCDLILHAGDLVTADALDALGQIAPVVAVRGNNDFGAWASDLHEVERVQAGFAHIILIHDLADLGAAGPLAGAHVVVSGHSHKPLVEQRGGVLFVNPGSAGPRRFSLPISVAELSLEGGRIASRLIGLSPSA